jgi:hypothetical protein
MWGFEAMGLELENPFGFDANDLPLTQIAATLHRDVDFLVEHPVTGARDWVGRSRMATVAEIEKDVASENYLSHEDMIKTMESFQVGR